VAPDLLGYGLSEHPDGFGFRLSEQTEALREFALAFELEGWIVVGQDWGGPLALGVAHAVLAVPNAGHFFQEDAASEVACAMTECFGGQRTARQTNKPSEALCYP
jgi:pimeloyl-ACP methyl ester carboxylesterase